jgi:hypothetical protein
MIISDGKLKYCPFRVNTISSLTVPNETYQVFAECIKENCMCYQRTEFSDGCVSEACYRDSIGFERLSKK